MKIFFAMMLSLVMVGCSDDGGGPVDGGVDLADLADHDAPPDFAFDGSPTELSLPDSRVDDGIPGDGPVTPDSGADSSSFGTAWYVDNAATGGNTGTSWVDAWKSFADIQWSQIMPGDAVFVSGGTASKTYHETLTVEKSGTAGKPITITRGADAAHKGQVIIDGQDTRSEGIYIRPQRYVTLSGFKLLGHTSKEIFVSGSSGSTYSASGASSQIIIEKMDMLAKARGVFVQTSDNITVRHNVIETPVFSSKQTDGIYSQRNHDNVYDGNSIIIYNTDTGGHDDCIQMFEDTSITVRNNYIGQVNNKSGNAQGIYATTMYGTTRYYNNVVNLGNAQSNGMSFRRLTGMGTVEMIGNTVYSNRAYHTAWITETPDPVVKNNIFFTGQVSTALTVADWSGTASNVDHNLHWTTSGAGGGNVASVNGSSKSWSAWQAMGFDAHGLNADPKVVSVTQKDFQLQGASPAIDKGVTLGAPFNLDKDGVSRPQGGGWDIGAYEK